MKSRSYKRPPIQEVIAEILLDHSTAWDLAVAGILYERLKPDLPVREKRSIQEVEIQQSIEGSVLNVKQSERAVFLTEHRRRLVQVGDRLLTVNQLPPYSGWQDFRRSVEAAYTALCEVVSVKVLRQLSLRYIDRIEIPGSETRIEDYFRFRPHFEGVEEGSPLDMWTAFMVGIQVPYDEQKDLLRIQMGLGPPAKDKLTYILEMDYRLVRSSGVDPHNVPAWLDIAHQRLIDAFEEAITDNLRELFQPV